MREDHVKLAAVYDFLSRLWLHEVDEEMLNTLNSDDLRAVYEDLGGRLPKNTDESTVDELAVDYCQLLVGPSNHVAPIQSIWQEQLLQAGPASSMRNYFALLPDFVPRCNIPDHFGVQLQFMSEIINTFAESGDDPELTIADEFFIQHLAWTRPFLATVAGQATTDFYIGLANLTSNFLHSENDHQHAC